MCFVGKLVSRLNCCDVCGYVVVVVCWLLIIPLCLVWLLVCGIFVVVTGNDLFCGFVVL